MRTDKRKMQIRRAEDGETVAASSTLRTVDPRSEQGQRIRRQIERELRAKRARTPVEERRRRPCFWFNLLDRDRTKRWRAQQAAGVAD